MLKERLKAGDIVFGIWCVVPSAYITNIISTSGFDFVIIDMEHSPISFETAIHMINSAHVEGISAIVRQGNINEENILKSLDIGSDGILVAHIETKLDALNVVKYSKYYPVGGRGFSPYTVAGRYSGNDIKNHASVQNDSTCVGLILEGKSGIDNLDEILETDEVDLIYIGAYDLSQALGIPGDVDNPEIKRCMEKCVAKIRNKNVVAGGFVAKNKDDISWMVNIGMQFITYLPDCSVIHRSFKDAVCEFRSLVI